jgi:glyoxylase-like metal-dependent hydrolase (beta-lactamase superfamily II)
VIFSALSTIEQSPDVILLAPGIYRLGGAVSTGVFVSGKSALLIDCCETVTPERLLAMGVDRVEMICMTQHRRPNVMGAYRFVEEQGTQIFVSEKDKPLFEEVNAYWSDARNRWHLYHTQPGPQVLPRPLPVTRTLKEGDTIQWNEFTLHVLETPGATEGAISYIVEVDGKRVAFIGDLMYGPGKIWDLYSLQKGFKEVGDYHGFLGMREPLIESLHKLNTKAITLAVPSHGNPFDTITDATALVEERLNRLFRNYVSISALNHYFPKQFEDMKDDTARMPQAEQRTPPPWIRRVTYTSFAVVSDSRNALLIDCGKESVLTKLDEFRKSGIIKSIEGCWVTHYHDDHVDSLSSLASLSCPIITDSRMADILEHPQYYCLPCIAPTPVTVARKTTDGESWTWREFTLTAFHFPGQTLYHGGLLVEGHGEKVFFAGDSGAPTGLDDYCAGNRTFLGEGRGSRRCLDIWRTVKPDYIINEHQDKAFRFTDEQLNYMEQVLIEREELIKTLTPWDEADFATDEQWVRSYPYEQEAAAGDVITISVQITNHSRSSAMVAIKPLLPPGWSLEPDKSITNLEVSVRTDGWVGLGASHPDAVLSASIRIPKDALPGLYVIPFSVDYNEVKFGAIRHALVRIR